MRSSNGRTTAQLHTSTKSLVLHSLSATTPKPIEETSVDLRTNKDYTLQPTQRFSNAKKEAHWKNCQQISRRCNRRNDSQAPGESGKKIRRGRNRRMSEAIETGVCWQASYFSVTITFSCWKIHFRLTVLHPSETPVARGQASFPPLSSSLSSLSSKYFLQVAHYFTRSRFPRSYPSNLPPSTFDWNI